jgi:hypothetical protein
MSKEELLKPRYKVIADYPGNPHKVNEILEVDSMFEDDNKTFPQYPHLFCKLEWWEERKSEDMPEYMKDADNEIVKVLKWSEHQMELSNGEMWMIVPNIMCFYEPATKEEYENQKQLNNSTMELPEHIKQKIEYNSPHPDAIPKPCIDYWKMGAGFGYSLAQQEIKERDEEIKRLKELLVFWWKVANRIKEEEARNMLGAKEFIDYQKQIEDRVNNFKEQNNL